MIIRYNSRALGKADGRLHAPQVRCHLYLRGIASHCVILGLSAGSRICQVLEAELLNLAAFIIPDIILKAIAIAVLLLTSILCKQ